MMKIKILRQQDVTVVRYDRSGNDYENGYLVQGNSIEFTAKASVQPQRPYQYGGTGDTLTLESPDSRNSFYILYCNEYLEIDDVVTFTQSNEKYRIMKVENWNKKLGTMNGMKHTKCHAVSIEGELR